jgi:hypothetical protein
VSLDSLLGSGRTSSDGVGHADVYALICTSGGGRIWRATSLLPSPYFDHEEPTSDRNSNRTGRAFLLNASALSGASLLGLPQMAVAEPRPEITKLRIHEDHLDSMNMTSVAEREELQRRADEIEAMTEEEKREKLIPMAQVMQEIKARIKNRC